MMGIRRLVVGAALVCAAAEFAKEIRWDYDDLKEVCDYLVSECRDSKRIKEFTREKGYVPKVILGEIKTRGENIDTSMLARQFQDALINSYVLDFVAATSERQALRTEKRDQDSHAGADSAKAIDNERAADFMLQGEIYFVAQVKSSLIYSVFVQFHDIEQNTIMFSKQFTVKAARSAASGEVGWSHYHSIALAIPFVNRSFDADGGADCDFDATTVGIDYSLFNVKNENKLAVLAKAGMAAGSGEIGAKYTHNSEITLDDVTALALYGRLGFGRAFSSSNSTLAFLPTCGVGVFYEHLSAEYESDVYSSSKDFTGYDVTLDVFINTFLAIMLTDNWGISFSFEISMNTWGAGAFTELGDYTLDAGTFSFMPAFGVCCRF